MDGTSIGAVLVFVIAAAVCGVALLMIGRYAERVRKDNIKR